MFAAHHSDDPSVAYSAAEGFLLADPIAHNVVLGLLAQRMEHPEPGNYWWVAEHSEVIGFAMQSPVTFSAVVLPVPSAAVEPLARIMHQTVPDLPGLMGEATTASRMAGSWTELAATGARPVEGQRIYEAGELVSPEEVVGSARRATLADIDLRRCLSRLNSGPGLRPIVGASLLDPPADFRVLPLHATRSKGSGTATRVIGLGNRGVVLVPDPNQGGHYACRKGPWPQQPSSAPGRPRGANGPRREWLSRAAPADNWRSPRW